ncbi:hypothetical protein SOM08_14395 [Hydrogenophaga sp. SNF1]|uniref:hypothetical protein n=1 Tax=Hydrogenophaga sp. SNF1 TaxID=3098762 RepID=UPI002ACBF63C|nr:hypothetical protein [Hydrogenophaga sp. SNF1]WQB82187.1 hypothetical protein SOM08_14395 [Hydrogenophaga sp. SNF1]
MNDADDSGQGQAAAEHAQPPHNSNSDPAVVQPVKAIHPVKLAPGMSLSEIAAARKLLDDLELVARNREQALAEIKAVLGKYNVVLNDLGLTEIPADPPETEDATSVKVSKSERGRGAHPKRAKAKQHGGRKLLKVLKADRTIAFTGGRCHKLGRKKDDPQAMDPRKWDDPTPEELRRWDADGTLE